jgi:hypothetical protein
VRKILASYFSLLMKRTGEFTRNKIAAFPYGLAAKDDQVIYSRDSAPEDFTLSDPDHLPGFQIEALYRHWLNRQQRKLCPFVILNASPQHQSSVRTSAKAKGKRKADYVPVSSSEDDQNSDDDDQTSDGDKDADQEEEAMTPPIRIGPPNRKTQRVDKEEPIAGSSKLPPLPPKKPQKMNQKSANKDAPIHPSGPSSLPPPEILKHRKDGGAAKGQGTAKTETDGRPVCFRSYITLSEANTV